jgi:hypothetical protein
MSKQSTRAARCLQWSRDAEAEGDAEAAGLWRGMAVLAAEKDAKAAPKRRRPCTTWNDSAGNIWCHTVNCDRHLSSNRKVW